MCLKVPDRVSTHRHKSGAALVKGRHALLFSNTGEYRFIRVSQRIGPSAAAALHSPSELWAADVISRHLRFQTVTFGGEKNCVKATDSCAHSCLETVVNVERVRGV